MKLRIVKVQHLLYSHYETEKFIYGEWYFDCAFAKLWQAQAYVNKQVRPKRVVVSEHEFPDNSIARLNQQER